MRHLLVLMGALLVTAAARAADCNRNGVEDDIDIAAASPGLAPRARLEAPRGATGLALADMNGDARLDFIIPGEPSDDVHQLLVILAPEPWRVSEPRRLDIGEETPEDFAVGDIDRDGDLDVVLAASPGVTIHRNDGSGNLETASPVIVGPGAIAVALGDLDGDGLLDIATANSAPDPPLGSISVALGAGGGSFRPARNYASGGLGCAILAADMDGDLDLDLALSLTYPAAAITVFLNDGDGAFLEQVRSDPSILPYPFIDQLAVGDLDRDGDLDIVVTSPDGGASFHRNDGSGRFVTAETLTPSAGDQPAVIADLDRDGDLDIALSLRDCPEVEVFVNDGGSFGESRRFPLERPSSTARGGATLLRAGDMDGDGDADIAALGKDFLALLANEPSGASTDCNRNGVPDDCETDCDANGVPDDCDLRGGSGDCDGDGLLDACDPRDENANGVPDACDISSGAGTDCNGNGRLDGAELEPFLAFPRVARESFARIDGLVAGDLDADGRSDLVVNADGALRLLRSRGLDFSKGPAETWTLTAAVTALEVADLDGDRDLDIACAGPLGSCRKGGEAVLLVLANGGAADFVEAGAFRLSAPAPESLRIADLDGDGARDIVLFRPEEGVSFLRGIPGGGFEDESLALGAPGGPSLARRDMAIADLDGDLDLDIALDGVGIYLQTGALEFTRTAGSLPRGLMAHGDLDGDGDVDLVAGKTFLRNDGDAAFTAALELGPDASGVLVADLDGDGRADAAVSAPGRLDVHFQRGGTLEAVRLHPLAAVDSRLAAGDLNGDGYVDIAAAAGSFGMITIYPGRPPFDPGPELESGGLLVSRLSSVHAADLDRDGDADLVATRLGDARQPIVILRSAGGRLERSLPPDLLGAPVSAVPADMDADGDPDILFAGGGSVAVAVNAGDGSFLPGENLPIGGELRAAKAADLDGDGDLDIIAEETGGLRFPTAFQAGDGSFVPGPALQIERVSSFILLADLDGDLDADLIAGTGTAVLFHENNGPGRFALLGGTAAAGVAGDWNGDGRIDLAVAIEECSPCGTSGVESGCECGTLAVLLNGGPSGFGDAVPTTIPGAARSLTAADLDLDGDLDLIAPLEPGIRPETLLATLVLVGDGRGTFAPWGIVPALEGPGAAAAGDIDGDGYPDIAIASDIGLTVHRSRAEPPPGMDANGDGVLDTCGGQDFRRGDWTQDGTLDISDPVAILGYLFLGDPAGTCLEAGDADDSGGLSITDPIRILGYLFQGMTPPAEPLEACGPDPTPDEITCGSFIPCAM